MKTTYDSNWFDTLRDIGIIPAEGCIIVLRIDGRLKDDYVLMALDHVTLTSNRQRGEDVIASHHH